MVKTEKNLILKSNKTPTEDKQFGEWIDGWMDGSNNTENTKIKYFAL